jgi:hypothetical protein
MKKRPKDAENEDENAVVDVKKRKGKKTMLLLMTDPAKQLMKREQKTSKKSDLDQHHHPSPNAQATEAVETEISIENVSANETVLETTNHHRTSTARATAPTDLDRAAAKRTGIASTDIATVVITPNLNRTTTWRRMY